MSGRNALGFAGLTILGALAGAGCGGSSSGSSGAGGASTTTTGTGTGGGGPAAPTVFVILMENHNWKDIKGSASAPYINSLLAKGAHAEQYYNPPKLHPSEPNYIWLEAGDNLGVTTDLPPIVNAVSTTDHLVTYLEKAGLTWKAYPEDTTGEECPIQDHGNFVARHVPMLMFKDVTEDNDLMSAKCLAHVRPYGELATDLASGQVPNYVFITPNLCNDMHNTCAPLNDSIKQGDTWLSKEVPKLQASKAYADGATIIITWDEGEDGVDGPIGMIVLGAKAKVGYETSTHFTHSSLLRTLEDIYGVEPYLGDAANAASLAEMFTSLP